MSASSAGPGPHPPAADAPSLIGYWFRFGKAKGSRLHVVRYDAHGEEVEIVAACEARVTPLTHDLAPGDLTLPQSAPEALARADSNQRPQICPRCLAEVSRRSR